jgi:hypothetical protein
MTEKTKDNLAPVQSSFKASVKRLESKGLFKSKDEIEAWEQGRHLVRASINETKADIIKKSHEPEQLFFSFMPTQMTRTTPFFPMSKREMKDRPLERLEWETPWGKIAVSGERLAVYDETILLNILSLVKKYRCDVFETTQYELCKLADVNPATDTYSAIWKSIKRLSNTHIDLEIWEGLGGTRKPVTEMTGTIITWAKRNRKTGKLQININPYFIEMYAASFTTNINVRVRAGLKGDTGKALYRFYEGQRESPYTIHILKLATAINLNITFPKNELRKKIRKGLRELRAKGYLEKWTLVPKSDLVTVWKAEKPLLNN